METKTNIVDISETLKDIYQFVKTNDLTSKDFEEYIKTMGAYNLQENNLKEFYIPYIFERSIQNCEQNILNLYTEKHENEIVNAMKKSFTSIFEVKRVLKNGFEAFNIVSESSYTLVSLNKMTEYRGIGNGHYIVARIFNFEGENYIIELSGILASNRQEDAMRYAMAKVLQEPYLVYENNEKKHQEIIENINFMYKKFIEAFNTDELITTNKYADNIIGQLNDFVDNQTEINIQDKLTLPKTLKYFEVRDLNNDYSNFVENSLNGFSSHKKEYDVGIIYDKEYGLYVVPFYKTLMTILEQDSLENIEGAKDCIEYYLKTDTISANILQRIYNAYPNFVEISNTVMNESLNIESILKKYKKMFTEHKIYSQTTVLYNSRVFNKTIGMVLEHEKHSEIDYSNIGRNEPCPCGSGKKYKNCCLKLNP